ncbi:MAG: efflux RND transporter permease subunit [Gammaproteobacteria bacterium]|uniref:AcrB/AcrD/AcrF family protein n=1 Tax=SAR86 cluster bacterium TaxID=2030880 RepID=A0A368C8E6_9GAMM|nr:MAG: AcrB/AcrD/AcrF family protein [SAR86 cluster bacterium]
MSLINIFIDRPRILILTLVFILLAGASSYISIPRQENPELAQRWASIIVIDPGASASRIETQVITKLESALQEIIEIERLDANIQAGSAQMLIELEDYVTFDLIEQTWSEILDKIALVEPILPKTTSVELIRSSGPPISVLYALTWKGQGEAPIILMSRLGDELRRKLAFVDNTERTGLFGIANEEVLVEIDTNKLALLNLSLAQVSQALAKYDSKKPLGKSSDANNEILLKIKENLVNVSQIKDLPIQVIDGYGVVRLQDIASVKKKPFTPIEDIALSNGKRTVLVEAKAAFGQRIDLYVGQADKVADEFREVLPDEIALENIYSESFYTKKMFDTLTRSIIYAIILVLLLSFFLLGLRAALIVSAILPFTISLVLLGCRILEMPLHQTSITGIIIALGLLIDNGIIVVEDYKHRRSVGLQPREAINKTISQLVIPLLAATFTTVFAFLPIATGDGASTEFVGGMAVTVILAITSSLFLALTIVPVMMAYLERVKFFNKISFNKNGYSNKKLLEKYRALLLWAYSKPRRAMGIALFLPFLGFFLFSSIPQDFFPAQDRNMFRVSVELPINSTAEETERSVHEIRKQILKTGVVESDVWFIGRRLPRILYNVVAGDSAVGSNHIAEGVYFASSYKDMMNILPNLAKNLSQSNPDIEVRADKFYSGPPVFAAIDYYITGDDPELLQALGEKLELIISKAPNISSTNATLSSYETNIEIDFNNSNMALSSKQMEAILLELAVANNGIVVGSMLDGNKDLPIRMKSSNGINSSIENIGMLTLAGPASVDYVENFGKTSLTRTSEFIERTNGEKKNSVQGQIWTGNLASGVEAAIKDEIETFKLSLPAGYSLESDGEADTAAESQGQIISSAAIFFVLIVIGLVAALNSFKQAGIILSVAILCIGLSFVGLVIGQQNYGFIATVGAIGLAGLAINDSIVVLSHIKEEAENNGLNKAELVEVVIRSTRHVLTTSATTIGGFLPLLFASMFFRPLAWGMVVGVIGSSIIAVFYIPAMFIYLKKIQS